MGKRLYYGDPSERPHGIWLAERAAKAESLLEDMLFQENVPSYPHEAKLVIPLQHSHVVVRVVVGLEDLGWPSRRRRSFCCGLSRRTLRWVGPLTDEGVQRDFMSLFKRRTVLNGDVFQLAPDAEVQASHRRMFRLRGVHVGAGEHIDSSRETLLEMLPPGARVRLARHLEAMQANSRASAPYLVDLEQWPGVGATCGPWFPSQLRHGTVAALGCENERVFLGSEHLAALGWHLFDIDGVPFLSSIAGILTRAGQATQKSWSGNGMGLPAIYAWMLYVLGNTVRVDDIEASPGRAVGVSRDWDSDVD